MIKDYTKEEMIDLVLEYSSINEDLPINFYVDDLIYVLEYSLPYDYLEKHHTEYSCVARLFEKYNETNGEVETILTIDADGLLYKEFEDGWKEEYIISSYTFDYEVDADSLYNKALKDALKKQLDDE